MNKINNIKDRILLIADSQGDSRRKFFNSLGVSSSGFRESNMDRPVLSDLLEQIVIKFNINAHWLLTGEGEMFQNDRVVVKEPRTVYEDKEKIIELLESRIRDKDKRIEDKEMIIEVLQRENESLRARISDAGSSKVG